MELGPGWDWDRDGVWMGLDRERNGVWTGTHRHWDGGDQGITETREGRSVERKGDWWGWGLGSGWDVD